MHSFGKLLLALAGLLVLAGALAALTPTAGRGGGPTARIVDPIGFDPQASLSQSGREVVVTGELRPCAPNEKRVEVQASVLQDSTLASANATAVFGCRGEEAVSFGVGVEAPEGRPSFAEGPAQACGLAVWRSGERIVAVRSWCSYVMLVRQ